MPELRIERGALISEGETLSFSLSPQSQESGAFLLRRGGKFFAFLNECPHWSVELDLGDGQFFDQELDRIYCKNHGALFMPDSGLCETGPCLGRSLTRYSTRVEGEDIVVTL